MKPNKSINLISIDYSSPPSNLVRFSSASDVDFRTNLKMFPRCHSSSSWMNSVFLSILLESTSSFSSPYRDILFTHSSDRKLISHELVSFFISARMISPLRDDRINFRSSSTSPPILLQHWISINLVLLLLVDSTFWFCRWIFSLLCFLHFELPLRLLCNRGLLVLPLDVLSKIRLLIFILLTLTPVPALSLLLELSFDAIPLSLRRSDYRSVWGLSSAVLYKYSFVDFSTTFAFATLLNSDFDPSSVTLDRS